MAMTTQALITAQTFGTSTNVGNAKFSANPVTLAAGTTAYVVNVQVTRPATALPLTGMGGPVTVRVWYTTTIRTVSAANAPVTLGHTARYVDCVFNKPNEPASAVISVDSSLEPKTGDSLHCWVDAPGTLNACTLDVSVVEVPS